MNVQEAYNSWSQQYDTNINKTRDLEALALKATLQNIAVGNCLEIGCGTGKNTQWLVTKAKKITAVDLSEEMLNKAKEKIKIDTVDFIQANITAPWTFTQNKFNLVTFSLVLEHIQHLDHIFYEASACLADGGHVYIGELHPFKQYTGSKARFETATGTQVVDCFTHHISEFIQLAKKHRLTIIDVNEHFDEDDTTGIPRILTLLLKKV